MLLNLDQADEGQRLRADVCIVGAGAAGITIARELAGSSMTVVLLESGGLEFDGRTQDLYGGEVVGHAYPALDVTRLRYFGGTTNHWGGFCRPLDAADFAPRAHVPHSGWPLPAATLAPYYERAQAVCELGPFAYDAGQWDMPDRRPLALDQSRVVTSGLFQQSPPTRFGEAYRAGLARAANVQVWLHANATGIRTTDDGAAVARLEAASLEGRRVSIEAGAYVLATGGLENARLLLAADGTSAAGLGNRHGNVGRYFMDHPMVLASGMVALDAAALPADFYLKRPVDGVLTQGFLTPAPGVQREHGLVNSGLLIEPAEPRRRSKGVAALRRMLEALADGRWPEDLGGAVAEVAGDLDGIAAAAYRKVFPAASRLFVTHFWCEHPPRPESRVVLGDEVDALGLRRLRVDWRLAEDFGRQFAAAHELVARELGRAGLGRLQKREDIADPAAVAESSHHQMGTTRMHDDPRYGVVDASCRVHGMANLYVAGGSVFPTCGHANPTLTIVALAIRLAEHLEAQSAGPRR